MAPGETLEAGTEPAATAEGNAYAEGQREHRGRRSRRRRRGGRGFPESKYASPASAPEAPPAGQEPEEEPVAAAPAADEILLLPGESLAKYRRAAQPVEAAPAVSREETPEAPPLDQRPATPEGEVAEPEAEDFEAADDETMEAILDRVDEMEQRADAAASVVGMDEAPSDQPEEEAEGEEAEGQESRLEAGEPASGLTLHPDEAHEPGPGEAGECPGLAGGAESAAGGRACGGEPGGGRPGRGGRRGSRRRPRAGRGSRRG